MADFFPNAISKITGKGRTHKAVGATRIKKFTVYRYDPDSGENPRYDIFEIDLDTCLAQRVLAINLGEIAPRIAMTNGLDQLDLGQCGIGDLHA